jgi:hypothetical protein
MIKMYPTPVVSDHLHNQSESIENWQKRAKEKKKQGINLHFALRHHVQMYPTPTPACEEGGEQSSRVEMTDNGGFILRKKNKPEMTFGAKLSDAMIFLEKMYPTPMARDHKDINFNTTWKLGNKSQNTMARQVLKDNKPGGKLNPNFVEFLMGYPLNWTKTEPTE